MRRTTLLRDADAGKTTHGYTRQQVLYFVSLLKLSAKSMSSSWKSVPSVFWQQELKRRPGSRTQMTI